MSVYSSNDPTSREGGNKGMEEIKKGKKENKERKKKMSKGHRPSFCCTTPTIDKDKRRKSEIGKEEGREGMKERK